MQKRIIASEYDTRGYLAVDCSECLRGGRGNRSCSSGWHYTKPFKGSCFSGEMFPEIKKELDEREKIRSEQ